MKDEFEVEYLNELDTEIFDEYFYKHLLSNVVKLIKEKSKIDDKTCACLETSGVYLQPWRVLVIDKWRENLAIAER